MIKIKNYLLNFGSQYPVVYGWLKKLIILLCIWVLYVRSYFIIDRTLFFIKIIIPLITVLFILLSRINPERFTNLTATYFFLWLGMQLIIYDELSSRISSYFSENTDALLSITILINLSQSKNIIKRHFGKAALNALSDVRSREKYNKDHTFWLNNKKQGDEPQWVDYNDKFK